MPNEKSLVEEVVRVGAYQLAERLKLATEAGEEAWRGGRDLADCPEEYKKPRVGDSSLFDAYVTGFKMAAIADGGGAD